MMEVLKEGATRLGYLFYVVTPSQSSFEKVESVPDYITEVIPYFFALMAIETVVAYYKGSQLIRVNDAVTSLSQGMLMELTKIICKGFLVLHYVHIYENWRLLSLPWNSSWTWFFALLVIDFAYYWFHRASHEVNLLWGAHQVHHSSEDYNLTTALRQSVPQLYFGDAFYLPLALIIPPSVFMVHNQLNVLYQFWIHAGVIEKLGPLELILNTPSHHRVHHGRNRYCIDKNYAGVLIIWDRMFGTFEPESKKVVYGLTHSVNSFDPIKLQTHHFVHMLKTMKSTPGIYNKLCVIFKGPGWEPGKPRLGNIEDIPDVEHPVIKYDPIVPKLRQAYVVLHFGILLIFHINLMVKHKVMPTSKIYVALSFMFVSLTSFGAILDNKRWSDILEVIRCFLYIIIDNTFVELFLEPNNYNLRFTIRIAFLISAIVGCFDILNYIYSVINSSTKNKRYTN